MNGSTPICNLSLELIQCCFRYAIVTDDIDDRSENEKVTWHCCDFSMAKYQTVYALSLTCRLFHQVAQPMLYEHVNITTPCYYDGWRRKEKERWYTDQAVSQETSFCRTIETRPELACFVKSLRAESATFIHLSDSLLKAGFKDGFPNLGTLALQFVPFADDTTDDYGSIADKEGNEDGENACAYPESRRCEASLKRLPNLFDLSLSGESLRFGNLRSILKKTNLRRLTLGQVDCPERAAMANADEGDDVSWIEKIRAVSDRAALPPPGHEGTATLTELRLLAPYYSSPWALQNFLRWPKSLEILTIGPMANGDYATEDFVFEGSLSYPWTFDLLSTILEPQRASLRELRVYQMGCQEGLHKFDVHRFPSLELLQVCASGRCRKKAVDVARLWLTPRLKKLVLQFSHIDSQCGHLWNFGPLELAWLDELVGAVAQRKQQGESVGLEEIQILFDPDPGYEENWGRYPDGERPPAIFVKANELVEAHGFKLTCPTNIHESPSKEQHEGESSP